MYVFAIHVSFIHIFVEHPHKTKSKHVMKKGNEVKATLWKKKVARRFFLLLLFYSYLRVIKHWSLGIWNTMHHSSHVMFRVSCLMSIWSNPSKLFLLMNYEWEQLARIALFSWKTRQFYCCGFAPFTNLHRPSPYDDMRLLLLTSC